MKDIIIKYWIEFVFGLIVGCGTALYKKLSKKVHKQIDDQKTVKDGTLALLRSEIIQNYDKYMDRGWIPIYGIENVLELYHAYHALGGNGAIDKIINELQNLPCTEQK